MVQVKKGTKPAKGHKPHTPGKTVFPQFNPALTHLPPPGSPTSLIPAGPAPGLPQPPPANPQTDPYA